MDPSQINNSHHEHSARSAATLTEAQLLHQLDQDVSTKRAALLRDPGFAYKIEDGAKHETVYPPSYEQHTKYRNYYKESMKESSSTNKPEDYTATPRDLASPKRSGPEPKPLFDCLCKEAPTIGLEKSGFDLDSAHSAERAWHEYYNHRYEILRDNRHQAEKTRNDAERIIRETEALVKKNQENSTRRLREYLHDVRFWKLELERQIMDMIDETETLMKYKKRLETALMGLDMVRLVCADNVNCRNRRTGMDHIQDVVECELHKEAELIRRIEHLLKTTLDDVAEQYRRNMFEKEQLEFDWSDKKEGEECGIKNVLLHNGNTNKQFYPGVVSIRALSEDQHGRWTVEEWIRFSHANLTRAEAERLASKRLRALVDLILYETARDLRDQADAVEIAFQRHIHTLLEALHRQEEELSKTLKEIVDVEKTCNNLRKAIRDKDDYVKVGQTRLHNNQYRPNREQRLDGAEEQLVKEMQDLSASIDQLQEQLAKNLVILDHLRHNQMVLEKDISNKKNNIFIDKEKCLNHRTRFPTLQRLLGHANCV